MRRDDLAPGLERATGGVDQHAAHPAPFAAQLLVDGQPPQLLAHALDFVGFAGRHGGQQARYRVEGALGVAAGELALMGPGVACVAQFRDERTLGAAQRAAEDLVPGFPHQPEQCGGVAVPDMRDARQRVLDANLHGIECQRAHRDGCLDFALGVWREPCPQQVQRSADAFVVGGRHVVTPLSRTLLPA